MDSEEEYAYEQDGGAEEEEHEEEEYSYSDGEDEPQAPPVSWSAQPVAGGWAEIRPSQEGGLSSESLPTLVA